MLQQSSNRCRPINKYDRTKLPSFFVPPFSMTSACVGLRPQHRKKSPSLNPSTRPSRPSQKSNRSNTSRTSDHKQTVPVNKLIIPGVRNRIEQKYTITILPNIRSHGSRSRFWEHRTVQCRSKYSNGPANAPKYVFRNPKMKHIWKGGTSPSPNPPQWRRGYHLPNTIYSVTDLQAPDSSTPAHCAQSDIPG